MSKLYFSFCEDDLSSKILRLLLDHFAPTIGKVIDIRTQGGRSKIENKIREFNRLSANNIVLILIDQDTDECPPSLIQNLIGTMTRNTGLHIRIAVREIEAWLLADNKGFSEYFKTSQKNIPVNPEFLNDPKETLINGCRKSRSKKIRSKVVPEAHSTARVGKEYNSTMIDYAQFRWDPHNARRNSDSLDRTIQFLEGLEQSMPL